jgi:MFS superfamily sulfate permease-like transporter
MLAAVQERRWLRGDLIAGVTVAACLIPQVVAYAGVARLSAVAGLWAALPPLAVYAVLGLVAVSVNGPRVDDRADDGRGDRPALDNPQRS